MKNKILIALFVFVVILLGIGSTIQLKLVEDNKNLTKRIKFLF